MRLNAARIVLMLYALGVVGCATRARVSPTPPTLVPVATVTATLSVNPTRPAADIDARLTSIAETVHPQATQTFASNTVATAEAIAANTALAPLPTPTLPPHTPQLILSARAIQLDS